MYPKNMFVLIAITYLTQTYNRIYLITNYHQNHQNIKLIK